LSDSNFGKVNVPNNLLKKAKKHCGREENKPFLNITRFSEEAYRDLLNKLMGKQK